MAIATSSDVRKQIESGETGPVYLLLGEDEVETSALTTAELLRSRAVASAYVVGDEGLRTALAAAGLTLLDGSAADPETVVVGWDRGFDYAELATACILVQRGASLIASNADASYPVEDGLVLPGAGAILAAIQTATPRKDPGNVQMNFCFTLGAQKYNSSAAITIEVKTTAQRMNGHTMAKSGPA